MDFLHLLDEFEKKLDEWSDVICQVLFPIQIALWLEVVGLALLLDILKLARPAGPPALIHRLPTELIIEILLSAMEGMAWSPTNLQRLASVCKYWRNIILSVPHFWHVIDSGHDWHSFSLVLRRNRAGPLDVCIRGRDTRRFNTKTISHLIGLITPKSRRIRSLNFTVKPNLPYFQRFFEVTYLPSLTSLTASVVPQAAGPVSIRIGDGVPFRYLSLDNVAVPWDMPRLQGLEVLSLSNLDHNALTIAQLHRILSSTPILRHLSLFNWKAQLMPGYWAPQEIFPITLPHLTDLEIQRLPEVVHPCLASMLNLPSLSKVLWKAPTDLWAVTEPGGPLLLRLSAQCIKASPELVISGSRWSWILNITSRKWTNTPRQQDAVEPCKSANLSLRSRNSLRLMKQVAALLNESNSVLFETNSRKFAKRVRKLFLRSGALFEFNISRSF